MTTESDRTDDETPGAAAEERAARFLATRGLRVIARNYRCRFGEIDLIAWDADAIVFVEVRMRRSSAFGGAIGSIDRRKQKKLTLTARHYLSRLAREPRCRFDAVLLYDLESDRIQWLRDIIS